MLLTMDGIQDIEGHHRDGLSHLVVHDGSPVIDAVCLTCTTTPVVYLPAS